MFTTPKQADVSTQIAEARKLLDEQDGLITDQHARVVAAVKILLAILEGRTR